MCVAAAGLTRRATSSDCHKGCLTMHSDTHLSFQMPASYAIATSCWQAYCTLTMTAATYRRLHVATCKIAHEMNNTLLSLQLNYAQYNKCEDNMPRPITWDVPPPPSSCSGTAVPTALPPPPISPPVAAATVIVMMWWWWWCCCC
jgi:hypothetical protein